jgi:hypothetical protein
VLRRRIEVARALAVARRPASQTPTVVEHAACPTGRSTRPSTTSPRHTQVVSNWSLCKALLPAHGF